VVSLHLPPLRERRSLIASFVERFVDEFSAQNESEPPLLSADVISVMESYDWPGNIRQLRNVIERAVTLCPGQPFNVDDLPDPIRQFSNNQATLAKQVTNGDAISNWAKSKLNAEIQAIVDALAKNSNNRSRAANDLGISRVTLYKKLHQFGLI
jgi:DNA-binding NtrC family response regulator